MPSYSLYVVNVTNNLMNKVISIKL